MGNPKEALVTLVVFSLALDLAAGLYIATGIDEDLGLSFTATDTPQEIGSDVGSEQETGSAGGDTLFGMYNQVAQTFGKVMGALNPALTILDNVGVPSVFINFLNPLVLVLKGLGAAWFLRGL
jgi:hypothetical protein